MRSSPTRLRRSVLAFGLIGAMLAPLGASAEVVRMSATAKSKLTTQRLATGSGAKLEWRTKEWTLKGGANVTHRQLFRDGKAVSYVRQVTSKNGLHYVSHGSEGDARIATRGSYLGDTLILRSAVTKGGRAATITGFDNGKKHVILAEWGEGGSERLELGSQR